MKFTALKTERVSLNGTHVATFIKGQEYEGFSDEDIGKLQEWGVAPSENAPKHHHEKPKAHNPVEANKMAHPVQSNKLTLGKKS